MVIVRLCLLVSLACGLPALALAQSRLARDIPPRYDPARFPSIQVVIDSLYGGRVRIVSSEFFSGFSPGGSRDIPTSEIQRARGAISAVAPHHRRMLIGATDPERFRAESHNRKETQLHNYSLGLARANYLNHQTGTRCEISTVVLLNDKRGVYLVELEDVAQPLPPHDHPHTHPEYALRDHTHPPALIPQLGVHAGLTYIRGGDTDFLAPTVGVSGRQREWIVSFSYGRTFNDENDDRIFVADVRKLLEREQPDGLFMKLGFVDARQLIVHVDRYTHRAVGGTLGLGYLWSPFPWEFEVNGAVGPFNVVTPDAYEAEWSIGLSLEASLEYRFGGNPYATR